MSVTPRAARAAVLALSAAAVLAAVVSAGKDERSAPPPIRVEYVFSSDARGILQPLVAQFNREAHEIAGRRVQVVAREQNSGETEAALASGTATASLWTPASSLWGKLLDHEAHHDWAPADSTSLFSSPQVIAMWKTHAQALGWPRSIGWQDILRLARAPDGWASVGHPEFGKRFLLGHTNPDSSTSGLSAVVSEYYAITRKTHGLSLSDIARPEVRAAVQAIEQSIIHYGPKAEAFLDNMDINGPPYAHAVYVQETQVRDYNAHRQQRTPLVPILPAEGTFVADYPLIRLRAPWIDRPTRKAAAVFAQWLPQRITPSLVRAKGFRTRPPARLKRLEIPSAAVLTAVRANWRADRKPANIALVVDTSSTMGGAHRLDAARAALQSFVRHLTGRDRVALITSGSRVQVPVPFGARRGEVARAVDALSAAVANGELPIYLAVSRAVAAVRGLHDADSINAVVVLSDGAGESTGYAPLLAALRRQSPTEGTSIRVFTIAYGRKADAQELQAIARVSGGASYSGAPEDVADLYRRIGSYF